MGGLGSAWLVDCYGTTAPISLPFLSFFLFLFLCLVSSLVWDLVTWLLGF